MKQAILFMLVLSAIIVGLIAWIRNVQTADTSYAPRVERRMWPDGGPTVAIDDAHWNSHTATRGYAPFAKLLRADGYNVLDSGNASSPEVLSNAKVVVVANALGFRGVVREVGQIARIDLEGLAADAFTDPEIEQLDVWVKNGGSLLIAAEPRPAGRAIQSLAERFDVTMRDAMVFDPEHSERDDQTIIVFTRQGRTMAQHPIIGLAKQRDSIERVVTFGGQALDGPPHATRLLMFSGTAYELKRPNGRTEDRIAVPGLAQALAMYHGRGKVVVLGDVDVLTSRVRTAGGLNDRVGLRWQNSDNELFARRIMGWLSGAVE
jgi:hypothetical protein